MMMSLGLMALLTHEGHLCQNTLCYLDLAVNEKT